MLRLRCSFLCISLICTLSPMTMWAKSDTMNSSHFLTLNLYMLNLAWLFKPLALGHQCKYDQHDVLAPTGIVICHQHLLVATRNTRRSYHDMSKHNCSTDAIFVASTRPRGTKLTKMRWGSGAASKRAAETAVRPCMGSNTHYSEE